LWPSPWEQHNFAAEAATVDSGMNLARSGERQPVNHNRMKSTFPQERK
jgi:hypothetical protein